MNYSLDDYQTMSNQMLAEDSDYGPSAAVRVYGDDGKHLDLKFWYSPEDEEIVAECLKNGPHAFFVKAYDEHRGGQDGINIQTGNKTDFCKFGYVFTGTIALRRLFAMNANNWTLQFMDERRLNVTPYDNNHLNLRRHNLMVVDRWEYWGRSKAYSLGKAKLLEGRPRQEKVKGMWE